MQGRYAGTVCIVVLSIIGVAAYGEGVYKWVDGKGKVHYGDKPPAEARASASQIETRSSTSTDIGGYEKHLDKQKKLLDELAGNARRGRKSRPQRTRSNSSAKSNARMPGGNCATCRRRRAHR